MTNARHIRVAIIGGGLGGIAAGVMLQRKGISNFTIYEKSEGFGGTWWENTYPGAEVDTPSIIYSFSFDRYRWSRTHATQPELLKYIEHTVDQQGLRRHFQLSTTVKTARWDVTLNRYILSFEEQPDEDFDAVISAVGFLNTPKIPRLPGIESFKGQLFHSARWPSDLDLSGKTVAVVGTGSTSVQIVSKIAKDVTKLLVFQREPNWIVPKNARDHTPEDLRRLASPWTYRLARVKGFIHSENGRIGGKAATVGTHANRKMREIAEANLRNELASDPKLLESTLPTYPFYGKRPVINDEFYTTLTKPNVKLIPRACEGFTEHQILDSAGNKYDVDIVVMATGFQANNYLANLSVYGPGDVELHDEWAGEPSALFGISVPKFPNFFMIYGPNTNAGPVTFFLECQARFAARCLHAMVRKDACAVEARSWAASAYDRWLQRQLRRTVWGTTNNYFKSASGRVVTQWPTGATQYWLYTRIFRKVGMRIFKRPPMQACDSDRLQSNPQE